MSTEIEVSRAQQEAIVAWSENPHLTNHDIANKVGVSVRTINRWRADPTFVQALVKEAKATLQSNLPSLYDVAVKHAIKGDWRFMKLIFDHVEKIEELNRDVLQENTFIIQWNNAQGGIG